MNPVGLTQTAKTKQQHLVPLPLQSTLTDSLVLLKIFDSLTQTHDLLVLLLLKELQLLSKNTDLGHT